MVSAALMAGATAAGALTSIGSSIAGAVGSSKYNKQARQLIQDQRNDNKAWFDRQYYSDFTQRPDAQAIFNKQRELTAEELRRARAINTVAGGTDESLALQQQSANDAMAQTMADVASQSAAYKDRVEQEYRQNDAALNQQQAADLMEQGANVSKAAEQSANAGANLMNMGLNGIMKAKK